MKVVVLNILIPYEFEVTIIVERGFKSIDLFKFIDETLKWKYCISHIKEIGEEEKIKELSKMLGGEDNIEEGKQLALKLIRTQTN